MVRVRQPATRPWIAILYFAFGVFFLLKPVLTQHRARVTTASLVGLIAAAILAPVAIGLVAPKLPSLGAFSLDTQTFVMLGTALVACGLAMAAVLAQVDSAPQTRASVEQNRLSMNAPPATLMDELDRTMQASWTERIPNRRYARIDPVDDRGDAVRQLRRRAVRGEPAAAGHRHQGADLGLGAGRAPPSRAAAARPVRDVLVLGGDRHVARLRAPLRRRRAAGRRTASRCVGTAAILAFVAAFCFQAAARLWGRFNFESVLTWVEMIGSCQTSRIGTGNNFRAASTPRTASSAPRR